MPATYPIFVNLTGLRIVVVGGGQVAARKVAVMLEHGATRIRLISPERHPDMPSGIEFIQARYEPGLLGSPQMVIAATNDAVLNRQIAADARKLGAMVNLVDGESSGESDFLTASIVERGNIRVAVNSSGVPGLSKLMCELLEGWLEPEWAEFSERLRERRERMKAAANVDLAEAMRKLTTRDAFERFKRTGEIES